MEENEILEAEKKEKFIKAYRDLVREHGYDFFQQLPPPTIMKVMFQKPTENEVKES